MKQRVQYNVNVLPSQLASAIHRLVDENIEVNLKNADEALNNAALIAVNYLQAHSTDDMNKTGRDHKRTKTSISFKEGFYRSGWHNYHYRGIFYAPQRYQSILIIVANKHRPTLTHLFEFGYVMGKSGIRHDGNGAIAKAADLAFSSIRGV